MAAKLLEGKPIAENIKTALAAEVAALKDRLPALEAEEGVPADDEEPPPATPPPAATPR